MKCEYKEMMMARRKKIIALANSYKTDHQEKWWFKTYGYKFRGSGLYLVSQENELTALIFELWLEQRDNNDGPLFHISEVLIGKYPTDKTGHLANFNHCWKAI
jgi:hypothetical protein